MENKKGNLKISGSGSSPGGVFNDVSINGSGNINGDVECSILKISGSGDVHGNVKAVMVKINGSGDIEGSVEAEDISLNGSGDIEGSVNCKTLKINGSGDIGSDVSADEVKIMGSGGINGNCEAEIFNSQGGFKINGLLNAGEINIEINGRCSVKEIGGERIQVRNAMNSTLGSLLKLFSSNAGKLTSDVIEGDDIYLESTIADVVRGKNVYIGPGCVVGKVEYINEIKISNESKVNDTVKFD